jgi:hypothetical protein
MIDVIVSLHLPSPSLIKWPGFLNIKTRVNRCSCQLLLHKKSLNSECSSPDAHLMLFKSLKNILVSPCVVKPSSCSIDLHREKQFSLHSTSSAVANGYKIVCIQSNLVIEANVWS